ncbi:NOB1 family endonuclease [[Eubacterium] cellulosolvens]
MKRQKNSALILDTSAFIEGINPSQLNLPSFTSPLVIEELRKKGLSVQRIIISHKAGKLEITRPSEVSLDCVQNVCQELGEYVLSKADRDLIALALELRKKSLSPIIVSDDFSVQNVSEYLEIEYISLANKGIQKLLSWTLYCPACYRRYRQDDVSSCVVCGTSLKRKPSKQSHTRFKE